MEARGKRRRTKNATEAVRPEPVEPTPPSRPVDWFSAGHLFDLENFLSAGALNFAQPRGRPKSTMLDSYIFTPRLVTFNPKVRVLIPEVR